ncbi:MAG: DUF4412 domain-containing protein [Deltaproteobacteria bacterium]|nr:DUF4412 domain-containing protein [Deltaproteobacteria bacterium]
MHTLALLGWLMVAAGAPPFEGVIEMKMTGRSGSGQSLIQIGKPGVRTELRVDVPGRAGAMTMVMLVKTAEPDKVYAIHDERKAYTEIDAKKARATAAARLGPHEYTARKVGTEKVGAWQCTHVVVTHGPTETDYWTSKDILDFDTYMRSAQEPGADMGALQKALKGAGAEGFVVKMVQRRGGAAAMTVELVRVEKKALDSAMFEVPAGYTKQEGPLVPGGLPLEAMDPEKLRAMTPEQRRELLERMKQGMPPPK